MAESLSQYEAMFLFGASAAADLEAAINLARSIIERHEGQILVIKKWDERKLAYEIRGQKRGTYIIAFFKAPGKAISAIEREVNLGEEILRVMVLKADHLNAEEMAAVEPQPIQPREERPSWEERAPRDRDRGDRGDRGDRDRDREGRPPRARREEGAEAAAKE
jgi:small subunit ribosomal protein S6